MQFRQVTYDNAAIAPPGPDLGVAAITLAGVTIAATGLAPRALGTAAITTAAATGAGAGAVAVKGQGALTTGAATVLADVNAARHATLAKTLDPAVTAAVAAVQARGAAAITTAAATEAGAAKVEVHGTASKTAAAATIAAAGILLPAPGTVLAQSDTPGDGSYTNPYAQTINVKIEAWGAGGRGTYYYAAVSSGLGGNSGAYGKKNSFALAPGATITWHVGAGVAGETVGSPNTLPTSNTDDTTVIASGLAMTVQSARSPGSTTASGGDVNTVGRSNGGSEYRKGWGSPNGGADITNPGLPGSAPGGGGSGGQVGDEDNEAAPGGVSAPGRVKISAV